MFIDLGANCGNSYLAHREEFSADADEWEAYRWEPSPQMHHFFLNDLSRKFPNVRILPYAAGVRDEELRLYIHKGQEDVYEKEQFRDKGISAILFLATIHREDPLFLAKPKLLGSPLQSNLSIFQNGYHC
jgi:hypothetical protein